MKVEKAKQKITDGIRKCSYGGNVNNDRIPEGDGMLLYGMWNYVSTVFVFEFTLHCQVLTTNVTEIRYAIIHLI